MNESKDVLQERVNQAAREWVRSFDTEATINAERALAEAIRALDAGIEAAPPAPKGVCTILKAYPDGVQQCELAEGHEGTHQSVSFQRTVTWPNDEAPSAAFVQTCTCDWMPGGNPSCPIHGKPPLTTLTSTYKPGDPMVYVDAGERRDVAGRAGPKGETPGGTLTDQTGNPDARDVGNSAEPTLDRAPMKATQRRQEATQSQPTSPASVPPNAAWAPFMMAPPFPGDAVEDVEQGQPGQDVARAELDAQYADRQSAKVVEPPAVGKHASIGPSPASGAAPLKSCPFCGSRAHKDGQWVTCRLFGCPLEGVRFDGADNWNRRALSAPAPQGWSRSELKRIAMQLGGSVSFGDRMTVAKLSPPPTAVANSGDLWEGDWISWNLAYIEDVSVLLSGSSSFGLQGPELVQRIATVLKAHDPTWSIDEVGAHVVTCESCGARAEIPMAEYYEWAARHWAESIVASLNA